MPLSEPNPDFQDWSMLCSRRPVDWCFPLRAHRPTARPLRWAVLESSDALVAAPFGLREPPEPWLPPTALGEAQAVFVPALAVDRRGSRLGRGAGYYDRSLAFCNPSALLIAVVRDDELVDRLPDEPHDVPMTHALTPGFGLVALS